MNRAINTLPPPNGERPKRRPLPTAVRLALLLLPVCMMLVLLLRTASALGGVRMPRSRTLFQFVLQGPSPEPDTVPEARPPLGPLAWPARSDGELTVFADTGIPSDVVEQSLRQQQVPFRWVSHPETADLRLAARAAPPGVVLSEVTLGGRLTLGLPSVRPEAVSDALGDYVWGSIADLEVNSIALGSVALYARPDAQAVREAKERGNGRSRPAPSRRWVSLPLLVSETPQVRLMPAMQAILPGDPCQLDLQVLGHDGEWYSVSARPETRFRVVPDSAALVPYGKDKGHFLAPVDASTRNTTQRLVVEAVLEGPGGLGLAAKAVVIVYPSRAW